MSRRGAPAPWGASTRFTWRKIGLVAAAVFVCTAPQAAESRAAAPKPKPGPKKPPPKPARSTTLPRVTKEPDSPHERRIAELRERLEAVLREPPLSRARVGAVVMQVSDGDVVYSHNAELRFNPASNTKILTTAAAIDRLGGDYRYRTALYGPAPDLEGVVAGDVTLRGSSDPSLSSSDMVEIARALADRGITTIRGDLVVDRRPIGWDNPGGGDGLILNRNAVHVRVRPGSLKHPPSISIDPPSTGITIENRATTVAGRRGKLRLDAHREGDHLVIQVRGKIGEDRGTVVLAQRVADGALLCGHTLAGMLPDFGVTLEGRVRLGEQRVTSTADTSDGAALALHRSAPLADVSRISNKPSNNFVADAIYKTLGGELFGLPGTLEKGTRAVSAWLIEHGIDASRFHLVNGSGLTHENRITPGDLANLLRAIYFEPALAPDFIPSLAVAGIDGTIRNRFQGTSAVGLVRAKTGTLNGVSALSGYVGEKGEVMVFSILVEGFGSRRTQAVRHAQVRMVDAMLRYLRAEAHPDEAQHPPEETSPEGSTDEDAIDYESDGDPQ